MRCAGAWQVFLRQLAALASLIVLRHSFWQLRRWLRSWLGKIPLLIGPKALDFHAFAKESDASRCVSIVLYGV